MDILLENLRTSTDRKYKSESERISRLKQGQSVRGSLESQYKPVGIAALTAASLCMNTCKGAKNK